MRKRVVTGAIAVVVIGVAAYVLSQPKKGTVEWHKANYMKCFNRMWGNTLWWRTERIARRVAGLPPPAKPDPRAANEALSHLSALVELGYLSERRYAITNRSLNDVLGRTLHARRILGRRYLPPQLTERIDQGQLVVVALPEITMKYDELIAQADVPEKD
jgi:hypothetical protein